MEWREKVLGPSHPNTIGSIRAFGAINFSVGAKGEALPLFEQAYSSACRLYGPDDPTLKEIERGVALLRELIDGSNNGDVDQKAVM